MQPVKKALIATWLLLSVLITGCSSTAVQVPVRSLTTSDVDYAMSYSSYSKRQAAIKALLVDASDKERIVLLTLLTEDCLAQAPSSGMESTQRMHYSRQACIDTGALLKAQLNKVAINYRPDNALVLNHLIDTQLNGLSQSAVEGLDSAQVSQLNRLCGKVKRQVDGRGLHGSFNRSLRKACIAHIHGDIDSAIVSFARAQDRSLSLCHDDLACKAKLPSTTDKPRESAWTTFKDKLFDAMGISLTHVDLPE